MNQREHSSTQTFKRLGTLMNNWYGRDVSKSLEWPGNIEQIKCAPTLTSARPRYTETLTHTHAHKCTVWSDDSTFLLTNKRRGSYQSLEAAVHQHEIVCCGFNHHELFTMVCVKMCPVHQHSHQTVHSPITELTILEFRWLSFHLDCCSRS